MKNQNKTQKSKLKKEVNKETSSNLSTKMDKKLERIRITSDVQEIFIPHMPKIVQTVITSALSGDTKCCMWILDKLDKQRLINAEEFKVDSLKEINKLSGRITSLVLGGKIDIEAAQIMLSNISARGEHIYNAEIEDKIARYEQEIKEVRE